MSKTVSDNLVDPTRRQVETIRVLVVEDDFYCQTIVHCLLKNHHNPKFEIIRAECFSSAVTYLSKESPAVILLDLNLPDSKGIDTLLRLQEHCDYVPIVILTGSDEGELGDECISRGAADFVAKQRVDIDSLVRCIRYAILRTKAEETRMRLLAIQDFMAMLAHDLQVPLIGSNTVLNLLIAGRLGELHPSQREALTQLQDSNNSQLKLVRRLIEIYRYESGVPALSFGLLDIDPIVGQCLQSTDGICQEKQLLVQSSVPRDVNPIYGDSTAIIQLLSGLLDNAIKFGSPGSIVEIAAENVGTCVTIHVKNQGAIIPPEERRRLFERFWTGVPGKKYVANVGLGLYLCHRIVTLHQGKITCRSDASEGTIFSVTLPCGQAN